MSTALPTQTPAPLPLHSYHFASLSWFANQPTNQGLPLVDQNGATGATARVWRGIWSNAAPRVHRKGLEALDRRGRTAEDIRANKYSARSVLGIKSSLLIGTGWAFFKDYDTASNFDCYIGEGQI